MANYYAGMAYCLCPWYSHEAKLSISCDGELVRFSTQEEKTRYRCRNCWEAIPKCERYVAKMQEVEAGIRPRAFPAENRKDYIKHLRRRQKGIE